MKQVAEKRLERPRSSRSIFPRIDDHLLLRGCGPCLGLSEPLIMTAFIRNCEKAHDPIHHPGSGIADKRGVLSALHRDDRNVQPVISPWGDRGPIGRLSD